MKQVFWTEKQKNDLLNIAKQISMPQIVVDEIEKILKILDTYYGESRNPYQDDGGLIFLIFTENIVEIQKEYFNLLGKYNLKKDETEFEDLICYDEKYEWHSDLFILSNDFGITIIYRIERGYAV